MPKPFDSSVNDRRTSVAHHLVAGLHVGQHRVVEHVGRERHDAVAEVVREQEHAVAPEKPRAVDDVGVALANQLDELRIFFGRVLEVGVLNDHQIAGHRREPAPQRRAFAGVGLVQQREAERRLQRVQDLARAVGRSIVDDDELDAHRDGEHAPDDFLDRGTLVEHGHDDREQRIGRDGHGPGAADSWKPKTYHT